MKRIVVAFLFVVAIAGSSFAQGVPPSGNPHCFPDPDLGILVCNSICTYPNNCQFRVDLPVGSYCWRGTLIGGNPGACFDGEYDPCCDPNYQW
jgi:hypothetical protein